MPQDSGVLLDYTTLISAANALNCSAAVYPDSVVNPYKDLLRGHATAPDNPMWLEMTCLADCLEASVLHEHVYAMKAVDHDRILDQGRYAVGNSSAISLIDLWSREGILRDVSAKATGSDGWLQEMAADPDVLGNLLRSMMRLLKEPVYSTIPDLFSHSQTVYKFDGESIWDTLKASLNIREIGSAYRRIAREEGFTPQEKYTAHFYPEEILCFFLRGLLYNDLAKQWQFAYQPHPARAILVASDALWSANLVPDYAQVPITFVRNFHEEVARYENAAAGVQLFDLDVPPIFAAILRESSSIQDLPRIAIELRKSVAAREYRAWVESRFHSGSGLKIISAQRELDELKRKLRLELGLDSQAVGISVWKITFSVRIPPWLHRMRLASGAPHTVFIKDLAQATLDVLDKERHLIRIWGSSANSSKSYLGGFT